MALSFTEHLDLLELHGRSAVQNLGKLSPKANVPPIPLSARATAEDHWSTLEVWAWLLENPSSSWTDHPAQESSQEYPQLVAAIRTELDRLARSLPRCGPDTAIEYFDRPGTVAEVARLLAHKAMEAAHSTGLAAGTTTLSVSPMAASDGIDQALFHWSAEDSGGERKQKVVAIRCTDTGDEWHIALNGDENFRLVGHGEAAVVVEGGAQDVLWWLHGYATPEELVTLSGDPRTIRDLRVNLMLPELEAPKRRFRFW